MYSVNCLGVKRVCLGGDLGTSRRVEGILETPLILGQFS